MIGSLGFQELLLILVIVLIVFGGGKLPAVGASLGKAIKGFKASIADDKPEGQAEGLVAKSEAAPSSAPDKPNQDQASLGKPLA